MLKPLKLNLFLFALVAISLSSSAVIAGGNHAGGHAEKSDSSSSSDAGGSGGSSNKKGGMDLRPGAVQTKSSLPVHLFLSTSTSIGSGVLAADSTFNPALGSSVSLILNWSVPKIPFIPKTILNARLPVSISWLSTQTGAPFGGVAGDRRPQLGDFQLGFSMPSVFLEKFTNIGFGLGGNIRAPLSLNSRLNARIARLGGFASIYWLSPKTPVGGLMLNYVLVGSIWAQDPAARTAFLSRKTTPTYSPHLNRTEALTKSAGIICRPEEEVQGGCFIPAFGGGSLGALVNSATASWQFGKHSFSFNYAVVHNFMNVLEDRPAGVTQNQNANEQRIQPFIQDSTLSYTYMVPVDFVLMVSAGINSQLPLLNMKGDIRVPFFDPYIQNNFHTFFVSMTAGI